MDFIITWYALGWAGLGIYCNEFGKLTMAELIVNLLFGGFAFLVHCGGWLSLHGSTPTVYNRNE